MKKNAFTLVELLGAMIIIAIILVIAIPRITNITDGTDKEKFKINSNEIYNLVKSDFLSIYGGTLSSNTITYTISSMQIQDGNRVLDTKLKENIDGYVEIDTSGDSKLLLENDKYCMIKEYADKSLRVYSIDDNGCTITGKVLLLFDLNGGKMVDESIGLSSIYTLNSQVEYPSIDKEGYLFNKWQLERGDVVLGDDFITIGNKNSTIKALWSKLVNLTVDLDGGILNDSLDSSYAEGSVITLSTPTKVDYAFTGWKIVSGNGVVSGNNLYLGNTDVTIKATYKYNNTNLVLDFDGGNSTNDVSGSYQISSKVELPIPTKEFYDFTGWEVVSGNGIISGNTIIIGNVDTKVKATYKLRTVVVTLDSNGGEVSSDTLTVVYGKTYENLPTPTKTYNNFLGWYTDNTGGEKIEESSLVKVEAAHTLYARWEVAELSITYDYLINNYSCGGTTKGDPVFVYTGTCEILDDSNGNWRIKFKTSGTITFNGKIAIDVFLVGGGGGGGASTSATGGGGGGYTSTYKNVTAQNGTYKVTVASGGSIGGRGGTSSFMGYQAAGGYSSGGCGSVINICGANFNDGQCKGGNGGSGGGNGIYGQESVGVACQCTDRGNPLISGRGGAYGTSGYTGHWGHNYDLQTAGCSGAAFVGTGQGTTTCEFAEGTTSSCTRGTSFAYSGGGAGKPGTCGGSNGSSGTGGTGGGGAAYVAGTANTGGGGGYRAVGGSGVVVIRNAR